MALQDYYFYSVDPNTRIEDYLKKSFAGNMMRYSPNGVAPIFGLTAMAGTGSTFSVEHGYFAKTAVFPKAVVTAAATDTDTTLTVDDTKNLLPGDIMQNMATGELMRIMSVTNATTITVLRAVGTQPAAAIAQDQNIYGIGNAHEQASLRPPSRLINPVRVMNFTQIYRNTWMLPGTMVPQRPEAGNSLPAESRSDAGFFHAQDIEKSLIFGQKSDQIVNNQYLTTQDGIVETVRRLAPPENTNTAGATTTYEQLEEMLEPVFDTQLNGRNVNERTLFVGSTALKVINQIGRLSGQYQIVDGQTNFGLQFQTFKTSRGTFRMMEHPILNTNNDWKKMALALDLNAIKQVYMEGRKTLNQEFGVNGTPVDFGVDAVGGTLTTEMTTEIVNPSAHAVIYGLTQGAAS